MLYRTLGVHLALASPRGEHKMALLNSVWKDVTTIEDTASYLQVAEVWISYPLSHLSVPLHAVFLYLDVLVTRSEHFA